MCSSLQSDGQDVETRLPKEEVVYGLWEKVMYYWLRLCSWTQCKFFKSFLFVRKKLETIWPTCDLVMDVVSALLRLSWLLLSGKCDFFLCFGWVMNVAGFKAQLYFIRKCSCLILFQVKSSCQVIYFEKLNFFLFLSYLKLMGDVTLPTAKTKLQQLKQFWLAWIENHQKISWHSVLELLDDIRMHFASFLTRATDGAWKNM